MTQRKLSEYQLTQEWVERWRGNASFHTCAFCGQEATAWICPPGSGTFGKLVPFNGNPTFSSVRQYEWVSADPGSYQAACRAHSMYWMVQK